MKLLFPTASFSNRLRLAAALPCVLIVVLSIYAYCHKLRDFDTERRYQSRVLADELSQSADSLTRLARAYILTGDPVYKQDYLVLRKILDNTQTPPDSMTLTASSQGLPPLQFSEAGFRKLARDQPGADTLTATEVAAMAMVDSTGSDLNARRIQASQLLEDIQYQKLKLGLLQPTRQYLELVERRTQLAVTGIETSIVLAGVISLLLVLILLRSIWRTLSVLRTALGESLDEVHGEIAHLAKSNSPGADTTAPAMGERAIGWWDQTHRQLGQIMAATRESEARLKQLFRHGATLRHFTHAIVRSTNEKELFEKICWAAVDQGGMKLAWIGMMDAQTRCIRPAACVGAGAEYLQDIQIYADAEAPSGQAPTGAAFRLEKALWCQDFQSDPSTALWHALGARLSWAANAAVPLRRNGQVVGVLTVYAGELNAFDQQTRDLLMDMVANMDYALSNFEREAERALNRLQRERAQQKEGLRSFMMERLSSDSSLDQILEDFVLNIEKQLPNAQCSILLIDPAGQHLTVSAAPTLPDFFNEAINGVSIGPNVGSCGTAAFSGQRVIVEDIAGHPDWAGYQDLARKAGLVSCWSEPIRSGSQQVLGAFAIYHGTQVKPTLQELEFIEMAASLTALAIERKRTETQLQLVAKVFEQGSECIVVTDGLNRIVRINHAFSQTTGYAEAEALGRDPNILSSGRHDSDFFKAMWTSIHTQGQWQGEIWNRRKNGTVYPERLSISVLRDSNGAVANYVAVGTDITQHKNDEEHIRLLMDFDRLTGLPNRHLLGHRVASELLTAKRHSEPLALMFLDLDRFKNVNDSLGHHIGDQLLISVARRLQSMLSGTETVYRLGGDEFVVLCPGQDATAAAQMANRVLEVTAQGYCIAQHDLATTLSIGIALYPTDGNSFETLSRNAENAMYQAKQAGRHTYRFFTASMQAQASRILQLENGLRRALELKQLYLVYQPQVSLHDGRVVGMEALLRWEHPTLGTVSPAEFIPVAEDSGLILSIGEWVLRTATQQLRNWLDAGLSMRLISVNLSVVQFRHVNLPDLITQVLFDANLPPQYLELELTESVAMNDPVNAIAIMGKLAQCGVHLSIDDFGTGYSSLSYLKRFSVHKLKIDQSFVRDITDDPDDKAIVVAIIALARSMGFKTLAEGVETQGQLDFLREQGCDDVQGYLYSAPLLPSAFEAFVRQHHST